MARRFLLALVLLSAFSLATPFGFGLFDYDDEDEPATTNSTMMGNSTAATPTSAYNCLALDGVVSYFNNFYEMLDKTFNPFYEPPSPPSTNPPPANNTPAAPPPAQG
uniref:Uncharacterized protein n=1 Tax=Graphocephala atropunctata TaxID=36148 RepID=A0A1B6MNJ1_9HEMI